MNTNTNINVTLSPSNPFLSFLEADTDVLEVNLDADLHLEIITSKTASQELVSELINTFYQEDAHGSQSKANKAYNKLDRLFSREVTELEKLEQREIDKELARIEKVMNPNYIDYDNFDNEIVSKYASALEFVNKKYDTTNSPFSF